jgi:hypothetical protein
VSCSSPLPYDRLVDYWSTDLTAEETDEIEAHLFRCESCTAAAERVSMLVQAVRTQIPTVVSPSDVVALRERGIGVVDNVFMPGVRSPVAFVPGTDLLVHHLAGLDLTDAQRVEVRVRSESAGPISEELFAPFDRERGEVLIACQRHFSALPSDIAFDVRVHRGSAAPTVATYLVPHVWG